MKKSQGLSMNTIVIAAIVILVLLVIIVIFSGRMRIFGTGLNDADQNADQQAGGFNNLFDNEWQCVNGDCPSGWTDVPNGVCGITCNEPNNCCAKPTS